MTLIKVTIKFEQKYAMKLVPLSILNEMAKVQIQQDNSALITGVDPKRF
jgi:hypothetical protein